MNTVKANSPAHDDLTVEAKGDGPIHLKNRGAAMGGKRRHTRRTCDGWKKWIVGD
jgi:hypothetical protein